MMHRRLTTAGIEIAPHYQLLLILYQVHTCIIRPAVLCVVVALGAVQAYLAGWLGWVNASGGSVSAGIFFVSPLFQLFSPTAKVVYTE